MSNNTPECSIMTSAMSESDMTLGEEVIAWIEAACRVPEGVLIGQPIELMDWQKREILRVYDNAAPTRRVIISVGRKSGKTTYAAATIGSTATAARMSCSAAPGTTTCTGVPVETCSTARTATISSTVDL